MVSSLPAFAWVGWKATALPRSACAEGFVDGARTAGLLRREHSGLHGLTVITASLAADSVHLPPPSPILIGVVFLGKTARREGGCPAAVYAGIGWRLRTTLHIAGEMRAVLIGAAFVLGSSVSYAFYQAGSEPVIRRLGAARFTGAGDAGVTVATLLHLP